MSFRVLVIPEDTPHDQHVLLPILDAMFTYIGRPAQVRVCTDPRLRTVHEALKWERIRQIIDAYRGMYQCFLLIVDRDGEPGRRAALDRIESLAAAHCGGRLFLAECAWQEVEVWCLAGHDLAEQNWQAIRAEPHAKEHFYEPFARAQGLLDHPSQGRRKLAEAAARRYDRIRARCPEDIRNLEDRLTICLVTRG